MKIITLPQKAETSEIIHFTNIYFVFQAKITDERQQLKRLKYYYINKLLKQINTKIISIIEETCMNGK